LLTGKARAGENEHTFFVGHGALVIVNASDCHQRIGVAHFTEGTQVGIVVHVFRFEAHVVRLGGVHPPTVNAQLKQPFVQVFPINSPGFGVIRVVWLHT